MNCNLAANSNSLDNIYARLLTNISDLYNLSQLINEHTRITETSSTLIDLTFTNCPQRVVCSGVSHVGISDHSLVYVYRKISVNLSTRGHSIVTYRKFDKFNSNSFRSDIRSQDWGSINCLDDPNEMWATWKHIFSRVAQTRSLA